VIGTFRQPEATRINLEKEKEKGSVSSALSLKIKHFIK
jgi:hypothetical protein